MSSTGYRIFENPLRRGKVAAEKVEMPITGSSHDHAATVETGNRSHIRDDFPQNLCAFQHRQIVEDVAEDVDWRNSQGLRQTRRRCDPLRSSCGKVHDVAGSCPMDLEGSTGRVEHHRCASWFKPL